MQNQEVMNYLQSNTEFHDDQIILKIHESEKLEFKQSLQLSGEYVDKKYLRTICGFSNNKGGLILFGIDPVDNRIIGINKKFDNLDNKYFSGTITEGIDGVIVFNFFTMYISNLLIGVLVVMESKVKPSILKTNIDGSVAGDILFRYPARTQKIGYADLRNILNVEIKNNMLKFRNQIEYILAEGPENINLINNKNGEISTEDPNCKLVLSADLLKELNLIQEGKLVEKDGSPAYIIKGSITSEPTLIVEREKPTSIKIEDIFHSFFNQECDDPELYLTELLFVESHFCPIFFFIGKAKLSKLEGVKLLKDFVHNEINILNKQKLIERIENGYNFSASGIILTTEIPYDFDTFEESEFHSIISYLSQFTYTRNQKLAVERTAIVYYLKREILIPEVILKKYCRETVEAITNVDDSTLINSFEYFNHIIKTMYSNIMAMRQQPIKTVYRKLIARLDYLYYGNVDSNFNVL